MDVFKKTLKKALERCKSINHRKRARPESPSHPHHLPKSRSWPSIPPRGGGWQRKATPQGCFAVYVGPHRQRFVVSAEHSGHPLFLNLLEDAVTEYGHNCQGPLLLPCDVDLFCKVLAEMDSDASADEILPPGGCSGMALCSPCSRMGYTPLSPSHMHMLQLNQF